MAITLEAIRAAGGIVHSDGNIFFRDISMLQDLAGAAPAAVAPLPAVLEQIAQGWDGCMYDAPGETLDIGADIRAAATQALADLERAAGNIASAVALRAALEAPAAPARIVADALIRLDAIYREEADCDEPPQRPDWLVNALHLAAAAPQAPAAPAVDASDDKALLDFLWASSCDLRSIDVPTGGDDSDVHWRVIEHYMSEPREREIGRSWSDDPREALRAAIAAQAKEGGAA
jgi:hypothetical protein